MNDGEYSTSKLNSPRTCDVCKTTLDNNEDSLHYNCGGACLQCMADAGDPESIERIAQFIFNDCLVYLNRTVEYYVALANEINYDEDLFRTRLLETFRPWP